MLRAAFCLHAGSLSVSSSHWQPFCLPKSKHSMEYYVCSVPNKLKKEHLVLTQDCIIKEVLYSILVFTIAQLYSFLNDNFLH